MERWRTKPSEKNAIIRVTEDPDFIKWFGWGIAKKVQKRMLRRHFLDRNRDQPLPKWATDIFYDTSLGFRRRIRVVMFHNFDILNKDPRKYDPGFRNDNTPKWLTEFRKRKIEEAKKFINKKIEEGKL